MLQLTREVIAGRKVILCIPGTYCSPEVFDLLDETAFPDWQVLPISWMTSPGPWDLPTLGRRVSALLQELNVGSALLVGHSTGGAIALSATLAEPSLVSGLLLVDTGANAHGHGDMAGIIKVIEQGVGEDFFQRLLARSFYHQPDAQLLQRMLAYASRVPPEAALEALRSQVALDLADDLSRITQPVMVIHGRYDQARPIAHAELLAECLPHAELCLLDCGHTPMVEDPLEYQQVLQRLCTLVSH